MYRMSIGNRPCLLSRTITHGIVMRLVGIVASELPRHNSFYGQDPAKRIVMLHEQKTAIGLYRGP